MMKYMWGGLIWCAGWLAMFLLRDYFDLSNLGLLLMLTSALAAVCLPLRISLLSGAIFILVFDWFFIPPKGNFAVDFHQHALMLLVMLVVNIIIVSLMSTQRAQSERAARHASEADILRKWSDALYQSLAPHEHIEELQQLLMQLTGKPIALLVLKNELPLQDDPQSIVLLGDVGIEQRHALWHCTRYCQQLGRGTGRYEMFSDVYLPLRARGHALGAALVCNFAVHEFSTRVHLQAICDQLGNALDRYRLHQQEILARENAQSQLVRNNLLAAISHDYRTPLATIMGAASSLNEQTEKLDIEKQHQLARRIYDEAERLNVMTSNILQLAKLDADNRINCDWQSAEEIVGDLMRRWRGRNLNQRLQVQLDTDLPLLWCDAILIGQLIENLVDNALKYSPIDSIVKLHASVAAGNFLLTVVDSGPGIDLRWRDRIFEPFQRGSVMQDGKPVLGAGVGLALCRAIALAHGGELRVECPGEGGSRFICSLPLRALPKDSDFFQKNSGVQS
jgi:two-component system sensor histidine kinase KdpD